MSVHQFILATNLVSSAEISNFLQGQGNRGITRPAIGREQIIPQIDPREIGSAFHRASAETFPPHRQRHLRPADWAKGPFIDGH